MEIQALIDQLVDHEHTSPCISFYQNTFETNIEAQKNAVQFKNLLKEAANKLNDLGWDKDQIDRRLSEARSLVDDINFWNYQRKGLAVFIAEDFFEIKKLPTNVKDRVYVDDEFYVRPLIKVLNSDQTYYTLALSKNEVSLYKGKIDNFEKVAIDGLPESYDAFRQYDVEEKNLGSASGGRGKSIFHGKGDAGAKEVRYERDFIKTIEQRITEFMRNEDAPLILAGVNSVTSVYKKENSFDKLWPTSIDGNADKLSVTELHEKTWSAVNYHNMEQIKEKVDSYADLIGSDTFSDNLEEIIKASQNGQVDTLLLSGEHTYGRLEGDHLLTDDNGKGGHFEVENRAAVYCLKNSGKVLEIERTLMPDQKAVAAVLRYPLNHN